MPRCQLLKLIGAQLANHEVLPPKHSPKQLVKYVCESELLVVAHFVAEEGEDAEDVNTFVSPMPVPQEVCQILQPFADVALAVKVTQGRVRNRRQNCKRHYVLSEWRRHCQRLLLRLVHVIVALSDGH